jgi:hypothetical protein
MLTFVGFVGFVGCSPPRASAVDVEDEQMALHQSSLYVVVLHSATIYAL